MTQETPKHRNPKQTGNSLPLPDVDVSQGNSHTDTEAQSLRPAVHSASRKYHKLLTLVIIAGIAGLLAWLFGDYLKLDYLATQENQLRGFQQKYPVLVFGAAFLIYVIVTGLSMPGAAPLTLLYGWYFGFSSTLILVSFASTAGATIAFLTSRYLLRESIEKKFGERLQTFNNHLESQGAFYLFTLRLIPVVPFFVINLVMGLTPVSTRTYWWVSQLGMLPGTAVYVYAGASVPNLSQLAEQGAAAVLSPQQLLQLFIAFALLGIFPFLIKLLTKWISSNATPPAE